MGKGLKMAENLINFKMHMQIREDIMMKMCPKVQANITKALCIITGHAIV